MIDLEEKKYLDHVLEKINVEFHYLLKIENVENILT